jgi:hypothetical protein
LTRWFRHYAGMMRDDKLVRCAIRAKQPAERVVWVWGAILESAAEIDDAGRFDFDVPEAAYFLRTDEADIRAILDALASAGRVDTDRVVKWSERQFQSDRSAERQARYRDKKRGEKRDGDDQPPSPDDGVTLQSQRGDAPETETQAELETEDKSPASESVAFGARDIFDEIWKVFPRNPHSSEEAGRRAFKALGSAEQGRVLPAVQRYAKWFLEDCGRRKRSEEEGRDFVPKLSTWLSNGAWLSAPPLKGEASGPVVAMVRIDQSIEPDLFAECGRVRGKPTPHSPWSFAVEVVDQARANLATKAVA